MSPWFWILIPLSYLIGTFPSAELAARVNGLDIRLEGSGNPGASNVTRTLGWKWGTAVMLVDAAKGAIPTAIGLAVGGRPFGYAMLGAAIIGHMFPIWRDLQGGKGVATAAGGYVVLVPAAALLGIAAWLVVSRASGKASVASLVLMLLAPVAAWVATGHGWEAAAVAVISLLVASRHGSNIKRLLAREEQPMSN